MHVCYPCQYNSGCSVCSLEDFHPPVSLNYHPTLCNRSKQHRLFTREHHKTVSDVCLTLLSCLHSSPAFVFHNRATIQVHSDDLHQINHPLMHKCHYCIIFLLCLPRKESNLTALCMWQAFTLSSLERFPGRYSFNTKSSSISSSGDALQI